MLLWSSLEWQKQQDGKHGLSITAPHCSRWQPSAGDDCHFCNEKPRNEGGGSQSDISKDIVPSVDVEQIDTLLSNNVWPAPSVGTVTNGNETLHVWRLPASLTTCSS